MSKAGTSETREKLIGAACRLFARHGYEGVSVRDIVHAAGANLGAVNYHFGSKESLFGEVIAAKMNRLLALSREDIFGTAVGPEAKLRRFLQLFAREMLVVDPELKALMAELLAGGTRLPPVVAEAVEWRNHLFDEVVQEGIKAGVFKPCDSRTAAWLFFGMLSAYMLYQPLMPQGRVGAYPEEDIERIVQTALDLYLNGLRRPVQEMKTWLGKA